MNVTGAIIDVHLSLPVSPTNRDMEWIHVLHIPARQLIPLSLRPFKLLRYMCFSIVAARGHLSFSKKHPHPVLYDSLSIDVPPDGTLNVYYHLDANQQPYYVLPINPTTAPNTPTSSVCSSNNSELIKFRTGVADRDGTCVTCDLETCLCEVVHLIRVSKGDKFITKLTEIRSVNHPDLQCISGVNDVRNGLLVNPFLQVDFGIRVAFLPIPNVYMDLEDIAPSHKGKSYIVHDFRPSSSASRSRLIHNSEPLRVASHDWPPDVLFDTLYASALCKSWGSECFRDYMTPAWNEEFCGRLSEVQGEGAQTTQNNQCNGNERDQRYPRRDPEEYRVRRGLRCERRKGRNWPWFWGDRMPPQMESTPDKAVELKVHEWLERCSQCDGGVE